jgi:hypothetical protein
MKKVLYILALVFVSSLAFTACSEEVVEPKVEETGGNGGSTGTDPIKNG